MRIDSGVLVGGDFRVTRRLSEGGMGAVYIALQESTGIERALKVMLPEIAQNPDLRTRFVQEAKVGSRIESEHVVQVIAAGIDGPSNAPWLVMELLRGEDLGSAVARQLPSGEQAREILQQLFHAVIAAHDARVVHRDLKPENIFLARSKRHDSALTVKVLDFGIAKITAEARTNASAAMGSPYWMAPEQAKAGSTIDPTTDVWALGLIVFFLFTGKKFWKSSDHLDATPLSIVTELCFDSIPKASERAYSLGVEALLPRGFDAWFARTVTRIRSDRFPTARETWLGLDALLRSATIRTDGPLEPSDTIMEAPLAAGVRTEPGGPPPQPAEAVTRPHQAAQEAADTVSPGLGQIRSFPASAPAPVRGLRVRMIAGAFAFGAVAASIYFFGYWRSSNRGVPSTSGSTSQPPGAAVTPPIEPVPPPAFGSQALMADAVVQGRRFYFDHTDPANAGKAASLFRSACDSGNQDGCGGTARAQQDGRGVPLNVSSACKTAQSSCEAGSSFGCTVWGRCYEFGYGGTTVDEAKATRIFQAACDGGEMLGCNNLGIMYEKAARSPAAAPALFQRACEGGLPFGCRNLAKDYEAGRGVSKDAAQADRFYDKACLGGEMEACYVLGHSSKTTAPPRAVELWRKSCRGEYLTACSALGWAYEKGWGGLDSDPAHAVELYEQACRGNEMTGCTSLGKAYAKGIGGLSRDDVQAAKLFERACGSNEMTACAYLAQCYEEGRGVEKDASRAQKLKAQACKGGYRGACPASP